MTAREGDGIEATRDPMGGQWERLDECAAASAQMIEWYAPETAAALRASAPDDGLRAAVEALDKVFWRYFALDIGGVDWRDDAAIQAFASEFTTLVRALLADQPPTPALPVRHDRQCAADITNGAARCQCATPPTQPEGDDHA